MLILSLEHWTFTWTSLFTWFPRRKRHAPIKISLLPRSARAQNQKRSHPMPAHRQDLWLTRIERSHDLVVIGHGTNRLLVHFLNDIALLQIGNARVGINPSHDNATNAIGQIELAREVGSQLADVNSRERASGFIFLARRLLGRRLLCWRLLWHNATSLITDRLFLNLGRHRHCFSTADNFQLNFLVQVGLRNQIP